jgi:DNA polymerase-3 subunit beta
MKLQFDTAELTAALAAAVRITSTRSAVQALAGVAISGEGDSIELRATDQQIGLRLKVSGSVLEPGSVVVPARLLHEVVRATDSPEVTIATRTAEGDVEVLSGTSAFYLRLLRSEDFPPLPAAVEGQAASVLGAGAFSDTVAKVARSASRDETRPVLTGILITAADSTLRMVATDSYRLCVKSTPLAEPIPEPLEANVPARALQEVVRLIAQVGAERISVQRTANQILFILPGALLSSLVLDGQFPNFQPLLPETSEHELHISREELAGVVRRVSLLAQRNTPLRFSFSEGELLVSAQTPDVGEARETLPVPFNGENFEIGFNAEFVRDGLESLDAPEIALKLTGPLRPGVIESTDGSGFIYLVMPVRLNTV